MNSTTKDFLPLSDDDHAMVKVILTDSSLTGGEHRLSGSRSLLRLLASTVQTTTAAAATTMLSSDHLQTFYGDNDFLEVEATVQELTQIVRRISSKMNCMCSGEEDPIDKAILELLLLLEKYTWDAKIVITLIAFSVRYGELWLTSQVYRASDGHPLAKLLALFSDQKNMLLEPCFEAHQTLMKVILEVATCIHDLHELTPEYIQPHDPAMKKIVSVQIVSAAYLIFRAFLFSSRIFSQTSLLHCNDHNSSITKEELELLSITGKVRNLHRSLKEEYNQCCKIIDEEKFREAYDNLVVIIESTSHTDNNQKILRKLLYSIEDQPLIKCPFSSTDEQRFSVQVLKKKTVMLLVSDLSITHNELFILQQTYKYEKNVRNSHEIVWLPVIKDRITPGSDEENKFNELAKKMTWYSLDCHNFFLKREVLKYITEKWGFEKKPMLVVLDQRGKVVCRDAIKMVQTWERFDLSFDIKHVNRLYWKRSWALEHFLGKTDLDSVKIWVQNKKHICIYGGDDIKWIEKFIKAMQLVVEKTGIDIDMVYVGSINKRERVKQAVEVIKTHGNEYICWEETAIWSFWTRLENMCHFKVQSGEAVDNDDIMKEVMEVLSYGINGNKGWAMIGKGGSTELVIAEGKEILNCLKRYDEWIMNVESEGLLRTLEEFKKKLLEENGHSCTRLILPGGDFGEFGPLYRCLRCNKQMKKFVLYSCCSRY